MTGWDFVSALRETEEARAMIADAPERAYWWVRDRHFGTVDIVLQVGPRWYSFDSPDVYRSESEIRAEYDVVENVLPPFWVLAELA